MHSKTLLNNVQHEDFAVDHYCRQIKKSINNVVTTTHI